MRIKTKNTYLPLTPGFADLACYRKKNQRRGWDARVYIEDEGCYEPLGHTLGHALGHAGSYLAASLSREGHTTTSSLGWVEYIIPTYIRLTLERHSLLLGGHDPSSSSKSRPITLYEN